MNTVGPSGKVGDFAMARFGSLPWELSRDSSTHQTPEVLSEMERFLYDINVDRKAGNEMKDFEYEEEEERNEVLCWSSPDKQQHKRKKRRRIVGKAKLRSEILGACNVVITTLSGAGSKAFIDAVCRDPTCNESEFDAVIIDEACQASEPEVRLIFHIIRTRIVNRLTSSVPYKQSLIPFKYNPTTIALVGDPQ